MIALSDLRYVDQGVMRVVPPGFTESIAAVTFAGPGHELTIGAERAAWARGRQATRFDGPDQIAARSVRGIVDRIIGWSDFEDRDEKGELVEVPFSRARATELLLDPRYGWLFTQCLLYLNSPKSFMPERKVE